MLKVWDGTDWLNLEGVKYWTGSAWDKNNKTFVRSPQRIWLPAPQKDHDVSVFVSWNVSGRTPPAVVDPTYPVPNLVGLSLSAAITALQTANLNVGDITYFTTTVLANDGKVSSQSLQPLLQVPENTFVNIVVFEYKTPTATIPQLNGLTKTAAENAIKSLGFVVGTLSTEETYDTALIGKVIPDIQYPTAGTVEEVGTIVTFGHYVQKAFATMPNLIGLDEFSVYSTLSAVNLEPGTRTTTETTVEANEGRVRSQQYNAGQQLQVGTTVNYNVWIPNTTTTVPNITGLTPAQAAVALENAELFLGSETTFETTNVALEGTIRSQQYGAGTTRPVDSTVNYVLYIPNTTTTVPNLNLLTIAQAQAACTTAELQLGWQTGTTETSNTSFHNKINTQSPAAGTTQPVNSSVNYNLYVPLTTGTVPSIINLTETQAASTLSAAGFVLGYETGTVNTNTQADVGKIVTQSPAANTSGVKLGSSVNYTRYVLNPNTTVPNIVGQTTTNANTLITNAGLNVGTVTTVETTNSSLVGTVQSQSPAAGGTVSRGTNVNYVRYIAQVYVPQPVTKTGTVYIWFPIQASYYGSGSRRGTNPLYYGKFSSTSTTGDQFSLVTFNWTDFDNACKATSGNKAYTVTGVTFTHTQNTGVGNSTNKDMQYGYYQSQLTSMPASVNTGFVNKGTQNPANVDNGKTYSHALNSTLRTQCFTYPPYPLVVHAATDGAANYGSVDANSTYFTVTIQWTEYV